MAKLVDVALIVLAGGALVVGSYKYGQSVERRWWRAELAQKSGAVKATMAKLGTEATDLDARLVAALGDADARLADAEAAVKMLRARPVAPPAASDDPCRPVPAVCLQPRR